MNTDVYLSSGQLLHSSVCLKATATAVAIQHFFVYWIVWAQLGAVVSLDITTGQSNDIAGGQTQAIQCTPEVLGQWVGAIAQEQRLELSPK